MQVRPMAAIAAEGRGGGCLRGERERGGDEKSEEGRELRGGVG